MNILFIGPPGSGKGTQAQKLIVKKNLKLLSTGDLFRKNLKEQTPLGQMAKPYIDKGDLVPDQITNGMVEVFLTGVPEGEGILFDGFPRNLSQEITFNQILKKTDRRLDRVIFLDVPDDVIIERLTGRLWAPESGCVYHIKNNPPKRAGFCDQSGEALVTREDDREEVIRSRLKVFYESTQPLLSHYKEKGLLKSIKATDLPEEVFSQVLTVLEES